MSNTLPCGHPLPRGPSRVCWDCELIEMRQHEARRAEWFMANAGAAVVSAQHGASDNLLRGSVAQHLDTAIDAAIAKGASHE